MVLGEVRRILGEASENFMVEALRGPEVNRAARHALDKTEKWHKRNCPLKPLLIVWLTVLMALHRELAIPNVFKQMVALIQIKHPGLRLKAVTPEALHHARRRLGSEPLRVLFEELSGDTPMTLTFRGLRVIGGDGTYFRLPYTDSNVKKFGLKKGGRGTSGYPQILAIALVDATTHKVVDVEFLPCNDGERGGLRKLIKRRLGTGDLLLMDRGLSSFRVFQLCREYDVNLLGRISATWKPKVLQRLGEGDSLVKIKPCRKEKERMKEEGLDPNVTLKLRMISYKIGAGETIRILTSLLDPVKFPDRDLAILYHQRWESEIAFDELKTHYMATGDGKPPTHFRSKKPDGILQEAYAMFVGYNLTRDLMVLAAEEHGVRPLTISFVDTLEVVKLWSPRLERIPALKLTQAVKLFLRDIADCKLPPRRGRRCPRKVKIKMSNYHRKRPEDKEERINFTAELRLVST